MYDSSSLTADHDLDSFDCGNADLNRWLKTAALRMERTDRGRVRVWTIANTKRVVAYYALLPTAILPDGLSRSVRGGFSGTTPGYLLAKLALDKSLHGKGLGGQLLFDAMEATAAAATTVGGRLLIADAIDAEAHAFYVRHGFTPINVGRRLHLRIDEIPKSGTSVS